VKPLENYSKNHSKKPTGLYAPRKLKLFGNWSYSGSLITESPDQISCQIWNWISSH